MFGVPLMFDAIAASRAWVAADLSSLRLVSCGGAPVPPATIAAYLDRGVVFSQGYGLTEAAPGVLFRAGEDSVRKAGTAGVPHFFTDARVVDAESCPVVAGRQGEVMVAGPNVIRGYWGRPEDTERSFADGWLRTGDIATVDDEGYISIVDRAKDMFISGGENVYPAEVERALSEHPDVADCAVIGVAHPTWGEAGKAVVVPASAEHATATELLSFLRGRLAGYKVPKSLDFAGELPRSPSGKPQKSATRGTPMSRRVNGIAEIQALTGTDLGRTGWRSIDQDRVNLFADAADDHQWIHTDPVRAAEGPFGRAIAHGYLTLALVIPMFGELLEIGGVTASVNYGLNRVRFPAPVRVGDEIRLHAVVAEAAEIKGGAQLTLDFTVELENGAKPACAAQAVYRYYA
jgi:acyl dehydratase